jgi:cupin fold WbuC family metalloprotein
MSIAVFHNADNICLVDKKRLDELKSFALAATMKRARLCLHKSDDDLLHEMLIVFHKDAIIKPHRHSIKTESYHVIYGELDVILFDDNGEPTNIIELGDLNSGKPFVYRISCPTWHTVLIRTEFAAIHEVTNGPFKIEESEFAPWAPEDLYKLNLYINEKIIKFNKNE